MNEPDISEKSHLCPQYLSGITALLLAVSCGLHFSWPSPTIPKLECNDLQFDISKEDISNIVVISPLGYVIGCPLSAMLLDRIGRKFSILILAFPQIIAWLLIAHSTHVYMLYIARITAGIAEGAAITTVPVYIGEISEPRIRGALGTGFSIGIMFGSFLINCYASYTSIRMAAYISLFLPMLFLVSFVWMPESPYYLLIKGKREKARKSLKRLRKMNEVEDELAKLTSAVERQISEPKSIKDVFTIRSNLKAFLIVVGLRTLQQLSGGSAISFYNQVIFQEAGGSISYVTSSIIFYGVLVFSSLCCTLIVDKFGRKPLLICSTIGSCSCLMAEGFYFCFKYYGHDMSSLEWLPLTALLIYTMSRSIGLMPIPTALTGELFSASIKAKAIGMANIYLAFCLGASTKLFYWLANRFGMHIPFFFYASWCVIGIVFICYCIPETNKKTLEEIQLWLKGDNQSSVR